MSTNVDAAVRRRHSGAHWCSLAPGGLAFGMRATCNGDSVRSIRPHRILYSGYDGGGISDRGDTPASRYSATFIYLFAHTTVVPELDMGPFCWPNPIQSIDGSNPCPTLCGRFREWPRPLTTQWRRIQLACRPSPTGSSRVRRCRPPWATTSVIVWTKSPASNCRCLHIRIGLDWITRIKILKQSSETFWKVHTCTRTYTRHSSFPDRK